jgi:sec-independent protein translocase protein TatC
VESQPSVPEIRKRRRAPDREVDEEDDEGGPVKSFLEHLEDLRWTLIKAGSALVVAMVVCLAASKQLIGLMKLPIEWARIPNPPELQPLEPIGPFMITLKIGFYAGLTLALPFILYFIAQFVVPALKQKEKKVLLTAFTIGTGFFLGGIVICYFFLLPFSIKALTKYNEYLEFSTAFWRAESFFEFATKFMLGVGLIFELPVVLLSLIRWEIIPHSLLLKGRRYMFLFNFVICAVMTPADLVTTFLLTMVLQVVYEVCILISAHWDRQRRAAK